MIEQYDFEDESPDDAMQLPGWVRIVIIIAVAAMIASTIWWIAIL